ncbi:MAG: serine protease [Candidatus Omnitrophota bacterium]|nr:serine protease [Candidatus Omnitrophota bacterium]
MADWKEMPQPEMMKILRRYCIAFWCVEYPDGAEQPTDADFKICGGSAFLWQADCTKFLVTAYHVWAKFRELILKRDRCLIFYLDGDHAIPIFGIELVSEDQDLDLAVLGGSGIENLKLDEKAFFRQSAQPSSGVSSGDRLALLGYPKDLRISEKPFNTIGVVYMQGAAIVGKYGLKIRMSGNPPNKFRSAAVPSLESFELPGTSGGPVFAFRASRVDWVGIVSECGVAPHSDVIIAPSRFIGEDGRITRPPTMLL